MRAWKNASVALKLSIGATVILALAVAWAAAAPLLDSGKKDDTVTARETDAGAEPDDAKVASKTLDLGDEAKISPNYRITVTEVSRYKIPKGVLVVPTITATYTGTENGEPWADLDVEFSGSGSQTFGETDCPGGLGHSEASEQPTLEKGDEETYEVCIELPVNDTKGGKVFVEEAFSDRDPIAWSTDDAVTKTLPSIAPEPPATQAPANRYQPRQQSDNDDDGGGANCDEWDQDKYDDAKERAEYYEDYYEKHKDDLDDETIDEYKDWKEDQDKMADYYKKWDKACD